MDDPETQITDVFSVFGNDIRIQIIRVLANAEEPLSFSDIHEQLSIRDSGQFNYHLNKLLGRVIRQTEEGKYHLSYSGTRFVGAMNSAEFEQGHSLPDFELHSICPTCDSPLSASYDTEVVYISCTGCDEPDTNFVFPPGGILDRDPAELTIVFDQWLKSQLSLITERICNNCLGRLHSSFTTDPEVLAGQHTFSIQLQCDLCPVKINFSDGAYLYLPAVKNFFHEHGVDLNALHTWNAHSFADPEISILSTDPWLVEYRFEVNEDTFVLQMDQELHFEHIPLE